MRRRASSAGGRFVSAVACAALCIFLSNCADNSHVDPRYGVEPSARVVDSGQPIPKGGGVYRVVAGRVYVPEAIRIIVRME